MGGSERSGPEHASASVLDGIVWVVRPTLGTDGRGTTDALESWIERLGARPVRMTPERHDRLVAMVSHLPQVASTSLMGLAATEEADEPEILLAGRGRVPRSHAPGRLATVAVERDPRREPRSGGVRRSSCTWRGCFAPRRDRAAATHRRSRTSSTRAKQARLGLATKPTVRSGVAVWQVEIPDEPGALARITAVLGAGKVNIEDLQIVHSPEGGRGTVHLTVAAVHRRLLRRRLDRRRLRPDQAGVSAMDVVVTPGGHPRGSVAVPGDKSIAHRWLILAATAAGRSRLVGLPPSLDVRSTAACLAAVTDKARPSLDVFARNASRRGWRVAVPRGTRSRGNRSISPLRLRVRAVTGWFAPARDPRLRELRHHDAAARGRARRRPVRVGPVRRRKPVRTPDGACRRPLRRWAPRSRPATGIAPLVVRWRERCRASRHVARVPSAQVKSAVLLAGRRRRRRDHRFAEPAPTRDHTERSLAALGAPVSADENGIHVERYQHDGFDARVPGDASSAAFLIAAAAVTGSRISIEGVGLNPTRLHFLEVMDRMGVRTTCSRSSGPSWVSRSGRSPSSRAPGSERSASSRRSFP